MHNFKSMQLSMKRKNRSIIINLWLYYASCSVNQCNCIYVGYWSKKTQNKLIYYESFSTAENRMYFSCFTVSYLLLDGLLALLLTRDTAVSRHHYRMVPGILDNVLPVDCVCMAEELVLINIDASVENLCGKKKEDSQLRLLRTLSIF